MLFSEIAAQGGVLGVAQIDAVQLISTPISLGIDLVDPNHPPLPPKNFVEPISGSLSAGSITPDPPIPPSK